MKELKWGVEGTIDNFNLAACVRRSRLTHPNFLFENFCLSACLVIENEIKSEQLIEQLQNRKADLIRIGEPEFLRITSQVEMRVDDQKNKEEGEGVYVRFFTCSSSLTKLASTVCNLTKNWLKSV